MDAETRAYLDELAAGITAQVAALATHMDHRFDTIERRMDALEKRMDALDQRMGGLEGRQDALERRTEEGFIGVDERFRTMERRLEQFEARVTTRFGAIEARLAGVEREIEGLRDHAIEGLREHLVSNGQRLENLEVQLGDIRTDLVGVHGRIDSLSDDIRQRFRVLGERVGGIERRLVA